MKIRPSIIKYFFAALFFLLPLAAKAGLLTVCVYDSVDNAALSGVQIYAYGLYYGTTDGTGCWSTTAFGDGTYTGANLYAHPTAARSLTSYGETISRSFYDSAPIADPVIPNDYDFYLSPVPGSISFTIESCNRNESITNPDFYGNNPGAGIYFGFTHIADFDAAGNLTINNLIPYVWPDVGVQAAGYEPSILKVIGVSSGANSTVPFCCNEYWGNLGGTIRMQGSGTPIAGASLCLNGVLYASGPPGSIYPSNAAGTYLFTRIPTGGPPQTSYVYQHLTACNVANLHDVRDGWPFFGSSATIVNNTTATLDFEMIPSSDAIAILWADPVNGDHIPQDGQINFTIDAQSGFPITIVNYGFKAYVDGVLAGSQFLSWNNETSKIYSITVPAGGYALGNHNLTIAGSYLGVDTPTGGTRTITIDAPGSAYSLIGKVNDCTIDSGGYSIIYWFFHNALEGVTVSAAGPVTKQSTTNVNGIYGMYLPLGNYTVSGSKPGYENSTPFAVTMDSAKIMDFCMIPQTGSWLGKCIDEYGSPLDSVDIYYDGFLIANTSAFAVPGNPGEFAISPLQSGSYMVDLRKGTKRGQYLITINSAASTVGTYVLADPVAVPALYLTLNASPASGDTNTEFTFTASYYGENLNGLPVFDSQLCAPSGVPAPFYVDGATFKCKYPSSGTKTASIRIIWDGLVRTDSVDVSVSGAPTFADIGLRGYHNGVVSFAVEPLGSLTSPLRIYENGNIYGVVLVDPSDANASKFIIQTSGGPKAIRKYP